MVEILRVAQNDKKSGAVAHTCTHLFCHSEQAKRSEESHPYYKFLILHSAFLILHYISIPLSSLAVVAAIVSDGVW